MFLDSRLDDVDAGAAFVGTDNAQSVGLVTEYLCRTGERPTFFEAPDVNHSNRERKAAYLATMERLGLQPEFIPVPPRSGWRFEAIGFSVALEWIDGPGFPTRTILCANDRIAIGVMAASFQRGLKIGRGEDCQLRVAGHDDQPLSRYTCPPLTTVAQDVERLSSVALDLLRQQIEGGTPAQAERRLEARLVMRASA